MTIKEFIQNRDREILQLFESGMRQKEIGKIHGLSESRVKHIIGEIRKQENKS